jgi:dipeptidase D
VNKAIQGLEPKLIWEHFHQISQIPRGSGNEVAVGEYIISVAKKNNLPYKKDNLGNIIVSSPATAGKSDRSIVVIQGHTDMVCEKNSDTIHDFTKDPIKLLRDGDWITADGTTLGADNGIGVCFALALMEDKSVERPAMEYLFTVDEETGLTGATGLPKDFVKGRILLNLDSEDEGVYYIGCAGGQHTILRHKIEWEEIHSKTKAIKISIGGLRGGHSGLNIHEGWGNSIKLLGRLLYNLNNTLHYHLATINGGSKHNAIPREAEVVVVIPENELTALTGFLQKTETIFKDELQYVEKEVFIKHESTTTVDKVFSLDFRHKLINLIYAMPHGVMAMSNAVSGLVETSTNFAVLETKAGSIELLTSQRSSIASSIVDIANKINALGKLAGFEVEEGGGYPPWQPNPNSSLLKLATETYESKYNKKAKIEAIHAGLECGIIGEKYPGMDMISFGPTIQGAHSPDERVNIPAVNSCWDYLLTLLKKI